MRGHLNINVDRKTDSGALCCPATVGICNNLNCILKEFLALRRAISLNETFVLFC